MASAFDQRIVQVSIDFEGETLSYDGALSIYATGQKIMGAYMNECQFRIYNLTKEQRNYLLSKTSPLKNPRTPVKMSLDVGRESYGTFRLFDGYVVSSSATQPPDVGIILMSITNNYQMGVILSDTQGSITPLRTIAQKIADNNGKKLDFQATDKQISNFSYNGSAAQQLNKLNQMGGIIAFIDNDILVVLDSNKSRGSTARVLNSSTGMVGIPQFTQNGVIVRMMIDNTVQIGSLVRVESEIIPAANGEYIVQKIFFEVASRDQQFFYTLECRSKDYYPGTLS